MADMSVNRIEALNGSNYNIWKLKVGAVLRSRKLFKSAIEELEPPRGNPGTEAEEKHDTWENRNDEAFSVIILTLTPEQAGQFIGETNARKVWNELERIHAGNAEDLRIDASLELKNIKMGHRESVDDYITRSRNLATKCAALGQVIPDREIVYYVVRGINERFETVASVLRPQRSIKLEDVQQALREEETRINSKGVNYGSKSDEAYRASAKKGTFRHQNTEKKCYVCHKPGHIAKNCWFKQGQRGESSFNQKAGQNRQHTGGRKKEYAGAASGPREERAFAATVSENANSKIDIWNLDSGCTSHMSPYLNGMKDVRESDNQINVAESDRSIIAEAKGNLELATVTSNGEKRLCLKDVLYVRELRSNLLSVKKITDENRTVVFDKTSAKIYDKDNDIIAEAYENDNLYFLETKRCTGNIENCLESKDSNVSMEKCSEKKLWHRRLGHINEEYLEWKRIRW